MIQPEEPLRLVAFEFRGWLKGGNTRPLLVAATDEDGNQRVVVLKLRSPEPPYGSGHYGGTSLACELICSVLARAADVQVPDYAIVDVPAELAAGVPDQAAAGLLHTNLGPNFGSVFVEGMGLWHERDALNTADLGDFFEQLLQLDASLVNGDRQARKSNVIWRGSTAYAIDHALALPVHQWPSGSGATVPMLPEVNIREHVAFRLLSDGGRQFSSVLSRWADILTVPNMTTLRGWIPASWEHAPGHLDRIFQYLGMCAGRADHVSTELRRLVR